MEPSKETWAELKMINLKMVIIPREIYSIPDAIRYVEELCRLKAIRNITDTGWIHVDEAGKKYVMLGTLVDKHDTVGWSYDNNRVYDSGDKVCFLKPLSEYDN